MPVHDIQISVGLCFQHGQFVLIMYEQVTISVLVLIPRQAFYFSDVQTGNGNTHLQLTLC